MTPNEAQHLILTESREGIAYSSRMGDYGTPERFRRLIEAIHVLQKEWARRTEVNRELFGALFVLWDQVNRNAHKELQSLFCAIDGVFASHEGHYESEHHSTLQSEFSAEPGSFLLQLRIELTWDTIAFSRLTSCMEACAAEYSRAWSIPRWIAEGFWYCSHFIEDWSTHPNFPRDHDPDYYTAAYKRLRDLAYWLFKGESPSIAGDEVTRLQSGR